MSKSITFNVKVLVDGKEQVVSMTSNVRELQKNIDAITNPSKKVADNFIFLNQKVQTVMQTFNGLNEVGDVLKDITAQTRTFSDAMLKANTMAGLGGKEYEAMKEKVTALSREIPVARDALAGGLYQVVSNGVPKDNWLSFLEVSARSSVGGCADLQKVVGVTSTVIKSYGAAWTDAAAIQDKMQLNSPRNNTDIVAAHLRPPLARNLPCNSVFSEDVRVIPWM